MNSKLKDMGFAQVKKATGSHHVWINQFGNIEFGSSLAREVTLRGNNNCVLYFNEQENVLGIHLGVWDQKKDRDLDISLIKDRVIHCKELIEQIEYDQEIKLQPEGDSKRKLEVTEIEEMERHSKMIIVELPQRTKKRSFRR
tara:strand:- start:986 stop:1411 length:426 start_codon:yes stop_codon:yes gene_type:complete